MNRTEPSSALVRYGSKSFGAASAGAAGDLQWHPQVARDACGEGRLAEARRTIEQDVAQRLFALAGRVDGDRQPFGNFALADHLAHVLRPQRNFIVAKFDDVHLRRHVIVVRIWQVVAGKNGFARHFAGPWSVVRRPLLMKSSGR